MGRAATRRWGPVGPRQPAAVVAIGIVASLGLVASTRELWAFKTTAGDHGAAPTHWPATTLARDALRPTVVMLLHPRCTCSLASLDGLARVLAEGPGVRAYVVVREFSPADQHGPLAQRLTDFPAATVVFDDDGALHNAFGTETSGHVLAYDPDGELVFSGGVTLARGETGDSPGARALAAAIGSAVGAASAPVFGCPTTTAAAKGVP